MKEIDLRWQLRQLPREMEPARELWPAIEAAIGHRRARAPARWMLGLAMAASVLLAAGLFWKESSDSPPVSTEQLEARIVSQESRAITHEYQSALQQYDGAPIAAEMSPSLTALDRSVAQIQSAIAADPDSVFLLEQLRKTYSMRLALTQRAVTG